MQLPHYQINAFTRDVHGGNPAGVCPLTKCLDDVTLQAIATENGNAETAFFVAEGNDYQLRWFTPGCEVDLCGHATLDRVDAASRASVVLRSSCDIKMRLFRPYCVKNPCNNPGIAAVFSLSRRK
ncbi:MAG TPA: hypothetical protein DCW29_11460, partial [Janthinobacterium sp.]|nr:hypothetical protein [Janthinobacterium sp.]